MMSPMKTLLLFSALCAASVAWCAKPVVIPELREWVDAPTGGTYTLSEKARVVIPNGASPELARYASIFAREIGKPCVRENTGAWAKVTFRSQKARRGDIVLEVKPDAKANPEAYTLTATPEAITISAPTALGAFWGTRSLLQVFTEANNTFPCGTAKDYPQYRVRGFMFDCGRKPFTLTTLRQIVRICSYYKLNDLQLHLSDNYIWLHNYPGVKTAQDVLNFEPSPGAFRLESKQAGLTATDLSYSKAQFRALVQEARNYGVTIVPELDVPGHALSLVRIRPDLMYKGSVGGKHDLERAAMLDLTNPKAFPFVASVFDEYIDSNVFQSDVVHIGTDEYYGDSESYRKFADQMLKHIRAKGKTPRFWGSLSHKRGKTPVTHEGVQMHIWSLGWQNPQEALNAGYDIINILDAFVYSVPSGNGSVGAYGDDIDSKRIYNAWTPANFSNIKVDPANPKLLGGAWAMWNDNSFLTDPGLCGRDLIPRIQKNCAVISQKCWAPQNSRSYEDFLAQIQRQASKLDASAPQAWERTYTVTVPQGHTGAMKIASGDETDLYAVSPVNGKVGFRREGAQYTFDYTLPKGKPVALTFHSKDRKTWLTVDGQTVGGTPQREHFAQACKYFTLPPPTK